LSAPSQLTAAPIERPRLSPASRELADADLRSELRAGLLGLPPRTAEPAGTWRPIGHTTRIGEALKLALDRLLAAAALSILSPLLLAIALAVRLDSAGPALYRQTRIGLGGRPFTLWKFRGMFVDAKARFPELCDHRYHGMRLHERRVDPRIDPRVTRVGRFLRRTGLDELPSLVNVLLGEMSLVGPRPEIPAMLPYYGPAARTVLSVRPGITSLVRLLRGEHPAFEESLELDVRYVRERSLRMDAGILLGTLWLALAGRASAGRPTGTERPS